MPHIYVADPAVSAGQRVAIQECLPAGWTLDGTLRGASVILTEHAEVTADMILEAGASLRLIARLAPGEAAIAAGAPPVVDLPNTALIGVAEHAVLLMLALSRRLPQLMRKTRQQEWLSDRREPKLTNQTRYTYNWVGLEEFGALYGKSVGIVGLGYIGRAVAHRLRPFGVRLLYTQRRQLTPAEEASLGVTWRSLDDLLGESDFVTLHLRFQDGPDGNDQQFGSREFGLMRPTAFFINTARGRLVDESALIHAMRTGTIAGAGLDVFRYEPLPPDHPFLAWPEDNLIVTPHIAGAPVDEAWRTAAASLCASVRELA